MKPSSVIFFQSSTQPLTLTDEGHPTEDEEADIRDLEVGDLNDMESDVPQQDLHGSWFLCAAWVLSNGGVGFVRYGRCEAIALNVGRPTRLRTVFFVLQWSDNTVIMWQFWMSSSISSGCVKIKVQHEASFMFFLLNIILHPLGTLEMHKLYAPSGLGDRRSPNGQGTSAIPGTLAQRARDWAEFWSHSGWRIDSHDLQGPSSRSSRRHGRGIWVGSQHHSSWRNDHGDGDHGFGDLDAPGGPFLGVLKYGNLPGFVERCWRTTLGWSLLCCQSLLAKTC